MEEKKLSTFEIMNELLAYSGLNAAQFLTKIGEHLTTIQDIKSGKTKRITERLADKITSQYPEISRQWLMLGTGDMIASEDGINISKVGDHNSNSGNITTVDDRLVHLLEEATQERMKLHAERDRLLNIIENLTSQK